jgi:hypothetical protein
MLMYLWDRTVVQEGRVFTMASILAVCDCRNNLWQSVGSVNSMLQWTFHHECPAACSKIVTFKFQDRIAFSFLEGSSGSKFQPSAFVYLCS